MSRSYRKHPVSTDGSPHHTKEMKRIANSKVRKTNGIFNGGSYKKLFCSYDIHDYICRQPKEEAIKEWYDEEAEILNNIRAYINKHYGLHSNFKNLDDYLKRGWSKWYKRK